MSLVLLIRGREEKLPVDSKRYESDRMQHRTLRPLWGQLPNKKLLSTVQTSSDVVFPQGRRTPLTVCRYILKKGCTQSTVALRFV